jgi:hypothetical protein
VIKLTVYGFNPRALAGRDGFTLTHVYPET